MYVRSRFSYRVPSAAYAPAALKLGKRSARIAEISRSAASSLRSAVLRSRRRLNGLLDRPSRLGRQGIEEWQGTEGVAQHETRREGQAQCAQEIELRPIKIVPRLNQLRAHRGQLRLRPRDVERDPDAGAQLVLRNAEQICGQHRVGEPRADEGLGRLRTLVRICRDVRGRIGLVRCIGLGRLLARFRRTDPRDRAKAEQRIGRDRFVRDIVRRTDDHASGREQILAIQLEVEAEERGGIVRPLALRRATARDVREQRGARLADAGARLLRALVGRQRPGVVSRRQTSRGAQGQRWNGCGILRPHSRSNDQNRKES